MPGRVAGWTFGVRNSSADLWHRTSGVCVPGRRLSGAVVQTKFGRLYARCGRATSLPRKQIELLAEGSGTGVRHELPIRAAVAGDRAWLDQTLLEGPGFEASSESGCENSAARANRIICSTCGRMPAKRSRDGRDCGAGDVVVSISRASFDLLVDFLRRRRDRGRIERPAAEPDARAAKNPIASRCRHCTPDGGGAGSVDAADRNPAAVERQGRSIRPVLTA